MATYPHLFGSPGSKTSLLGSRTSGRGRRGNEVPNPRFWFMVGGVYREGDGRGDPLGSVRNEDPQGDRIGDV